MSDTAMIKPLIRVQPAPKTDHITEDGEELTQKPYPFIIDQEGLIQGDWNGRYVEAVGFAKDLAEQQINLWWEDVPANPNAAVGMYLVTADSDGEWGIHMTAIETAEYVRPQVKKG